MPCCWCCMNIIAGYTGTDRHRYRLTMWMKLTHLLSSIRCCWIFLVLVFSPQRLVAQIDLYYEVSRDAFLDKVAFKCENQTVDVVSRLLWVGPAAGSVVKASRGTWRPGTSPMLQCSGSIPVSLCTLICIFLNFIPISEVSRMLRSFIEGLICLVQEGQRVWS